MPYNDILFDSDPTVADLQRLSALAHELVNNGIAQLSMTDGDRRCLRVAFQFAENGELAIQGVARALPGRDYIITPPKP